MQKQELAIGVLLAPFGLKGDIRCKSFSGEVQHLLKLAGTEVVLVQNERRLIKFLESVKQQEPHLLFRFRGYESPEKVRELTGYELMVERQKASALKKDEYYIGDLIGLKLVGEDGRELGSVKSVWETGAHSMLEVERLDQRVVQVPFREPFIGIVSLSSGTIEVLQAWIIEEAP